MQTSICPVARGGERKTIPFEDRLKTYIDEDMLPELKQVCAEFVWRELGESVRHELGIKKVSTKIVGYEMEYERPQNFTAPTPHLTEGNFECLVKVFFDTVLDDGDRMVDWWYEHRMYYVRFQWPDPKYRPTLTFSSMDYLTKSLRGAVMDARFKHKKAAKK